MDPFYFYLISKVDSSKLMNCHYAVEGFLSAISMIAVQLLGSIFSLDNADCKALAKNFFQIVI